MIERERFLTGEEVDLSAESDRTIPASLLESLISGPDRELPVALRIKGAIIEGKLNLRFVSVAHEVMLRDCEFKGELNCRGTRFNKSAHFTRCRFADAYFERARVNGTLLFNDSTFDGVCSLLDAVVDDNVVAVNATFENDFTASRLRVAKSLVCSGSKFKSKTHLLDAQIGATAEFEGVELAAIDGSRMSVGGVAFFRADKTKPAIFHERATFKLASFGVGDFAGALFESDADFVNCSFGRAANFGSLVHGETLFRTVFQRRAAFIGARADGWFIFAGARFDREAVFESCRAGGADFRPVLLGSTVVNVWFRGDARFYGFAVDGSMLFNAAVFERDAVFGAVKVALSADFEPLNGIPVRVGGDFWFDGASVGGGVHAVDIEVRGQLSFSRTRVEQGLAMAYGVCRDGRFIGTSVRTVLDAQGAFFEQEATFDGLTLPGTLRLSRVRAERIRMVHAEVGGTVELAEVVAQQINLSGAYVKHDVQLTHCDAAAVRLAAAHVDGAVDLRGASVWSWMNCSDARIGALLLDDEVPRDTRLPLSIDMRRFTFTSLSGDGEALLPRSEPFDRDAYIRIEALHRTRGEDAEARHVYYAMRERATNIMWKSGERLRWFFNRLLDALFAYGARPARLLLWSMLFIALGTWVFSPAHPGALVHKDHPATIAPRLTDAVIVSAKLFVPTPDLAPSEPFVPGNTALYALVHRLCGAIIVPVGILFLTGLFFRR